jgi:hypothetical protein
MGTLSEYQAVSASLASFNDQFDGAFVPIASNSLSGAGIYSEDDAVCRFAAPLDSANFADIDPPDTWTALADVLQEICRRIKLEDAFEFPGPEWTTIMNAPGVWGEAAGKAYSNYIKAQFEGYIEFASDAIKTLIELNQCQTSILLLGFEEMTALLFSSDADQTIELAKQRLVDHISSNPNCKPLLSILDALSAISDAIAWLVNINIHELWENFGQIALIAAEILRDGKLQEKIRSIQNDPVKLGKVHGTLIGVIIWEVIESVISGGTSKGLRFLKVIR